MATKIKKLLPPMTPAGEALQIEVRNAIKKKLIADEKAILEEQRLQNITQKIATEHIAEDPSYYNIPIPTIQPWQTTSHTFSDPKAPDPHEPNPYKTNVTYMQAIPQERVEQLARMVNEGLITAEKALELIGMPEEPQEPPHTDPRQLELPEGSQEAIHTADTDRMLEDGAFQAKLKERAQDAFWSVPGRKPHIHTHTSTVESPLEFKVGATVIYRATSHAKPELSVITSGPYNIRATGKVTLDREWNIEILSTGLHTTVKEITLQLTTLHTPLATAKEAFRSLIQRQSVWSTPSIEHALHTFYDPIVGRCPIQKGRTHIQSNYAGQVTLTIDVQLSYLQRLYESTGNTSYNPWVGITEIGAQELIKKLVIHLQPYWPAGVKPEFVLNVLDNGQKRITIRVDDIQV